MNIYGKLTILCLFLVLFSSSVLFYFTNRQVENAFKEELLASITSQSEETIKKIDRFIFSRLNDVRMASKNPYFRIGDIADEEMTKRLQELENLNDLYYSFSFFNMDRVRLADSKRLSVGKTHANQLYWEEISKGSDAVMDISKSESIGRVVMQFATVVNDYFEEEQVGVIVGRILVDELYKAMGNISLSSDSTRNLNVNLMDNDGLLLYSNTNPKAVLTAKYESFDIVKGVDKQGVQFIETEEELFFVAKGQGYLNYAGNDWIFAVSISKEEAFLPVREIQNQLLWVMLPVILISIILALVAANIFVKPIIKLSQAAEELSKGNLQIKLDIKSKDEVGKLAKQVEHASEMLYKRMEEQKELNDQLADQKDEIESQKSRLEEANTQIEDSIKYAQRIQQSILPSLKVMDKVTKGAFIINKPKDVVSGDFYWFERVRQGRNEYLVIACADCTGHGVPGSIMSIMGSNQLTNIVYYQNYLDPNKILARVDKQIKLELQRDGSDSYRDGMEMGLISINLDDLSSEFSGAGIQLHLLRNGELTTFKGPRAMIGGMDGDEKTVSTKLGKEAFQLLDGDKIYMFSDGFQDQFGGENDKRFMAKNLKALIVETATLPMKEQQQQLETAFQNWIGETPQTDDVLVMGIEI